MATPAKKTNAEETDSDTGKSLEVMEEVIKTVGSRGKKSAEADTIVVKDDVVTLGLVKFDVGDFVSLFIDSDLISQIIVEANDVWPLVDREIKKMRDKSNIVAIYINIGVSNEELLTENVMKTINLVIKNISEKANARWAFRIDKHLNKDFRVNIILGKSLKVF